jgi:hypothetical protein
MKKIIMKKERKKMLLRQIGVIVWLACFASGVFAQNVSKVSPERVKPEEFIIFPWGWMPMENVNSGVWGDLADADGMMKDLFDCGYNTTGFIAGKYVKYAAPYRLAVILSDGRVASHPDEPNALLFPRLNVWSDAIKKQGILPYINLFPNYASDVQLGSNGYEDHLNSFVNTCKPPYLSYDNYSLSDDEVLDENRFYSNLEAVRKKSLQQKIPFWNVILGNSHFRYSEPSAATFNIQVYSTLAYGGKGIGYFTHYAPTVGNYRLASIDQFGYRTKTWALMRNVNMQIHALAPIYCKLKSVNVFHVGNVPKNAQGKDSAVHLKSINDEAFLVGEFVDPEGKPYLLVVNKDTKKSVTLEVAFKKEGKITLISPFSRGKVPFQGEQKWLALGAGVLLTVE